MLRKLLAGIRFFIFVILSILFILLYLIIGWIPFGYTKSSGMKYRAIWTVCIKWLLGLKINKTGNPGSGPHLYLSNHRSYIDPIVLFNHIYAMPVAKAEINKWPIIGFGAKMTGILFVDRGNKGSRANTLSAIGHALTDGLSIILFPEGTTHLNKQTIQFKKGTFGLAASQGFTIIPVAIEYRNQKDAWVDNDTFVRHFMECFGKWTTEIKIHYGAPIEGDDAFSLLDSTQQWIDSQLDIIHREWNMNFKS